MADVEGARCQPPGFSLQPVERRRLPRVEARIAGERWASGRSLSISRTMSTSRRPSPNAWSRSARIRSGPPDGKSFGPSCRVSRYSQTTRES